MTEKIRIELEDATAAGAEGVEKNLESIEAAGESTEATLNDVIASIEKLSDNLTKETRIVNEHTSSWTHFGSTAIPALASLTKTIADTTVEFSKLVMSVKTLEKANELAKVSQNVLGNSHELGIKTAARLTGAIAGYGEAVSGVLVTLAAVKGAQLAFNTLMENTGKSADGLTNNLTRLDDANSQLWDDIKATASAGAEAVAEWGTETVANAMRSIDELVGVSDAWKEIDRAVTESTNNYVNNTRVIGEAIRGVSREAVKASQDIAKAQADAVDDFERVRMSNEEVAQAAKNRAEAERLAALDTVEAIDAELQAMKQRRGEAAAAGKFSEDDQRRYTAVYTSLEERRTQVAKRQSEEREKILKDEAKQRDESTKREFQRYEDAKNAENDNVIEGYRQQARDEIAERKARERAVDQFIEREMQKILDEERKKFEAMQQAAKDRLELLKRERQARIDMLQNATNADGQNMLGAARQNIDPRKLREEVARRAEAEARANWVSKDGNAATAGAQRDAAAKQARMEAFRRFNLGNTSQEDIAAAQNSLIGAQVQQAQSRGLLDQQTADALMQAAQNQQNIIAAQERQAQQMRQIQTALAQAGTAAGRNAAASRRSLLGN